MQVKKVKNTASKILDVPILIMCLFAIGIFVFVFYHSMFAIIDLFVAAANLRSQMFFAGILMAIVWATTGYVQGFINLFAKTFRHLFNKDNQKDTREVN